jgi:kinesin family protein 15
VCLITTFYDLVFQLDIFEHVGVPLVENCLAGFNSSVFAYGQVSFFSLYFFYFAVFLL